MSLSTPLLDNIDNPSDLKKLPQSDLSALAVELRQELVSIVSKTGGHLGAGLGVVELTLALHYVFDAPDDRLIWDVGHQAYPHKILTGRRHAMPSLRQEDGLSGFTKRTESPYDPFGAAHSSTSISAGLGMAVARDLSCGNNHVICVIGDGAMSAGMAFEAMNNAGALKKRLIVILNDNDMSIAPPVGAMSHYLSRLWTGKRYHHFREFIKKITSTLPEGVERAARLFEEYVKGFALGGTLFEELGFHYFGPVDGHDLDQLIPLMRNLKSLDQGAVLLHVVTQKGKGYAPAEAAKDKYHGVVKFDPDTGQQQKALNAPPSYTKVFANKLCKMAETDPKIVAITAAMPDGTGVDVFAKQFPERAFDVGIAEQHAVTFAAGMATEGYKPFVAIYSTFLQRAYDQIVHDVAIQNLPVRFAIDRAGLVGADGATHAGSFDVAYLGCLPNMVLMAAADADDLEQMVAFATEYEESPCAFRYPRGDALSLKQPETPLLLGKGRVVRQGQGVAILSYGARLSECLLAADTLAGQGIFPTIVNMLFAKPLDTDLLRHIAQTHQAIITIEEGSVGGFGSLVLNALHNHGYMRDGLVCRTMTLPDIFMDQATPQRMYEMAELDRKAIIQKCLELIEHPLSLKEIA